MAQLLENPPALLKTWVRSLGWEDTLEKGTATHSSILTWRIPETALSWGCKSQTRLSDFHFFLKVGLQESGVFAVASIRTVWSFPHVLDRN